jgi:NADH-quinone oxidoreductase subunit L
MTFHGKPRANEETMHHVHESPWSMLGPLCVLAVGATVLGKIGYSFFVGDDRAQFWKSAILVLPGHQVLDRLDSNPAIITYLPLVAALAGIALAYWAYMFQPDLPGRLAMRFRALYLFLVNKWYFDDLYDRLFVRSAFALGDVLWRSGDGKIIDGLGPDGIATATRDLARQASRLQTGYVYHYAFAMLIGVVALVTWYLFPR